MLKAQNKVKTKKTEGDGNGSGPDTKVIDKILEQKRC